MANVPENIGPRRLVVGAHYGTRDWLAQRATAILMAIYTVVLLVAYLFGSGGYQGWAGLFAIQWFKILTLVVILSMLYHVWVGMRNVWMDYVKPVALRLLLQTFTIVWLVGCAGYSAQILWKV